MATYDELFVSRYTGEIRVDALLDENTLSWNYILPARTTLYYTFDTSLSAAKASGVVGFNAAQKPALQLDGLSLFRHFNLFGVWEGRSPGPAFDLIV